MKRQHLPSPPFSALLRASVVRCGLVLGLLAGRAEAETTPAGKTAFSFEQIESGARGTGMGGAYVALVDDATATGWNPAGLARLRGFDALLGYNLWFQEVGETSLHAAQARGPFGFGLSAAYLSIPSDTRVDGSGAPSGAYTGRAFAARAGGAYAFGALSLGLAAGIASETLDRSAHAGANASLGALYALPAARFGLVVQRVGPSMGAGKAPTDIRIGGAWTPSGGALALEIHKPLDHALRVVLGGEWRPAEFVALRAGYRMRLGATELTAISGLSTGFGLAFTPSNHVVSFDYAFWPLGELGPTHRVTIGLRPAPVKASSSHGASTPSSSDRVRISDMGAELSISWSPMDEPGIAGYLVFAAIGGDPMRKLTGSAVTSTSLRMKKPTGPSGSVLRVRVRAVNKDGAELADTEEATFKLP